VIAVALYCGAAIMVAACDRVGSAEDGRAAAPAIDSPDPVPRSAGEGPATEEDQTNPQPTAPEGPRLTFTRLVHDFGRISDVHKQPCRFPFTNTGDERLVISDIKASCGCTATSLSTREFAPGEGAALEVVYTPGGRAGRRSGSASFPTTRPAR